MTDPGLITRRMLLRDMGKAGLAVVVFGAAACGGGEVTTSGARPSTSTSARTNTTGAGEPATTAPPDGKGVQWQRVDLGFVSAYILYRGGEAAIVDTGVAGSEASIEAALTEIGLGWDAVGTVVLTHLHQDHQGSLPAVIAATGESIPWFAGAADMAGIEAPTEGQAVRDGDTVFHGLDIIETPGHTPGHIAVLDPVAGVLVAGDALSGGAGRVAGPNPQFTPDMASAGASVVKLAGFSYEVALFGHGEPVLSGASDQVVELAATLG